MVTKENTPAKHLYDSQGTPQTSASAAPPYNEKFPVDNKNQAGAHVYPEVAGKDVPPQSYYPNAVTPNPDEQDAILAPKRSRRYCGMSRKAFLIVLVVVALVVVGAVAGAIGGVLGSKKTTKDESSSSASCTGSK